MEYIVHLKSLRVKARSEGAAIKKAEAKLKEGFSIPEVMVEDVEAEETLS